MPVADEHISHTEVCSIIKREIERLPHPYRLILNLYHFEEIKYEEIAQILEMPVGTVKNYLYRARRKLKQYLLRRMSEQELVG